MLLRNIEPPILQFPASMLSIRIASMLFTCCFELPNLPFLASMLSIRIASMLFTCCFEASNHPVFLTYCQCAIYMLLRNHPIFHSRPVYHLYVLPLCHLHAASKLRTTQSSIPGQYAIYKYCQYAIYMLLRSIEPPNLPFPASMLSIRIASMLFTCCFEASNHPIFHSRPVCYLQVLPVCYLHAASKHRTTQSSIPGQYAIYKYCQYAIYMLLRSFEPPNLPFPVSMLSIHNAMECWRERGGDVLINRLTRYILKGQRHPIPSSLMCTWYWRWSQKPLMWTLAHPKYVFPIHVQLMAL